MNDLWEKYAVQKQWNTSWPTKTPQTYPLERFTDADLILEMVARGYAVAKLPAADLAKEVGKS